MTPSNLKPYTVDVKPGRLWFATVYRIFRNGVHVIDAPVGKCRITPDEFATVLNDAYQAGLKVAPCEQETRTKQACIAAINDLKRMTHGRNPRDPGIEGINLALDAAVRAVEDVRL